MCVPVLFLDAFKVRLCVSVCFCETDRDYNEGLVQM